ncbi:MAG TPA: hypothetical protein VNI52_07810 [Sphingobacteriaceae bacterium]|nr:hypothetical protein [Sphingobacteriaceae bacterium]
MSLRELLLKGRSFNEILKQFAIDQADFTIRDEDTIMSNTALFKREFLRERILIQGKSKNEVVNFFGTLHCNLLDKLAVFELDGVERTAAA